MWILDCYLLPHKCMYAKMRTFHNLGGVRGQDSQEQKETNFFGTLKSELFYPKKYNSIEQLEREIKNYISYYNNDRISGRLKGMSPIKYRAHYSN